ncbi:MAG: GNAT family N-acetyltransferase [Clostridia bacterium]|nr:GNAT family N-acetyltransferase [Clostridia bacterium]
MEILTNSRKYLKELKELYIEAFPKEERKTFTFIEQLKKEGKCIVHTFIENENFVGLAIVLSDEKYALIDYLAVSPKVRSLGIGSKILNELKKRYKGKCLFLERETILKNCENPEQRKRRRDFYLRNEFSNSEVYVNVYSVEMTLMTYQNNITFEEYSQFLKKTLGEKIFNKIKVQTSVFSDENI